MIETLYANKSRIVSELIEHQMVHYPDRTQEYSKCLRDLNFIYESYIFDLQTHGDWYIKKIGSYFWKGNKRQIVEYSVEVAIHKLLADKLIEILPDHKNHISHLQSCLEDIIVNGNNEPDINPFPAIVSSTLQTMAHGRQNWKPLAGHVKPDDVQKILSAANGVTPALSNEYNYRVSVVPERHKETLLEKTATYSETAAKLKPGYAVDKNFQYLAPLLLCFSIKENPDNPDKNQWGGPITKRDPNLLSTGICMWHTVMTAVSLGYKTSFINISDFKVPIVKEILGLVDPEPDLRTLDRDGKIEFSPTAFIAIGSEGTINGNSRPVKEANVVNRLIIND